MDLNPHDYLSWLSLRGVRLSSPVGLLRDFLESPVTSVSLEAVEHLLINGRWAAMRIAHLRLFGVNIKYDRTTRRSSF
jgi:hypothetical protein